jgi:hypothetical protein
MWPFRSVKPGIYLIIEVLIAQNAADASQELLAIEKKILKLILNTAPNELVFLSRTRISICSNGNASL